MEGLEIFHFKKLILSNPKLFEPMFINTRKISTEAVKKIMNTEVPPANDITKLRILHAIGIFLDECQEEGKPFIL